MKNTLNNLTIDQVDHVDSNVVNVHLNFDSGKGYYEGGINADVTLQLERGYYESQEDEFFVDEVSVNLVENEDCEPIEYTYNPKHLKDKVESLLHAIMYNGSMSTTNEDEIFKALS